MPYLGVVRGHVLLKALALPDQRPLQDDSALLVALAVLGGKFVDPAQLAVAILAADVSHHVPARQHHPVLDLAVLKVHYLDARMDAHTALDTTAPSRHSPLSCWKKTTTKLL